MKKYELEPPKNSDYKTDAIWMDARLKAPEHFLTVFSQPQLDVIEHNLQHMLILAPSYIFLGAGIFESIQDYYDYCLLSMYFKRMDIACLFLPTIDRLFVFFSLYNIEILQPVVASNKEFLTLLKPSVHHRFRAEQIIKQLTDEVYKKLLISYQNWGFDLVSLILSIKHNVDIGIFSISLANFNRLRFIDSMIGTPSPSTKFMELEIKLFTYIRHIY